MILAAGVSPAWQQIMVFHTLEPGEVNRAVEVHWCASGKALNVGQALARLGAEHRTLSILGGPTGEAIEREFAELDINCRWLWTTARTRVCTTLVERNRGRVTELVENAAPCTAETLAAFRQAFAEEARAARIVVLTGSLPQGAAVSFFRELLEDCSAQTILDIRGPELMEALSHRPFLVKPNREELAATFERTLEDDHQLLAAMRELNHLGAEWALVTQGRGPVWLSSLTEIYRITIPEFPAMNPIGCGDCLAAGLAWGVHQGLDVAAAMRLGIAAAMENARQLLPSRLDPQRVRQQAAALVVEHWTAET